MRSPVLLGEAGPGWNLPQLVFTVTKAGFKPFSLFSESLCCCHCLCDPWSLGDPSIFPIPANDLCISPQQLLS